MCVCARQCVCFDAPPLPLPLLWSRVFPRALLTHPPQHQTATCRPRSCCCTKTPRRRPREFLPLGAPAPCRMRLAFAHAHPARATLQQLSLSIVTQPQPSRSGKFIVSVLDDTHLFIKADKVEWVQEKVSGGAAGGGGRVVSLSRWWVVASLPPLTIQSLIQSNS